MEVCNKNLLQKFNSNIYLETTLKCINNVSSIDFTLDNLKPNSCYIVKTNFKYTE